MQRLNDYAMPSIIWDIYKENPVPKNQGTYRNFKSDKIPGHLCECAFSL